MVAVQMQRVTPPERVKPAFDEVNASIQQRDQSVNEANRERNRLIPQAEASRDRLIPIGAPIRTMQTYVLDSRL